MASEPVHKDGKKEGLFVGARLFVQGCAYAKIMSKEKRGHSGVGAQTAVSGALREYGVVSCLGHYILHMAIWKQTNIAMQNCSLFLSFERV